MTKQEFLAASLPYDLQVYNEKGVQKTYAALHYSYEFEPEFEKFTPILRPLSDINKEIEHKGEKFVPISRIKESQWHLFFRDDITSPLEGLQFSELRKLIEWHFDLFGGIESGEAIDVNTLDINPYES